MDLVPALNRSSRGARGPIARTVEVVGPPGAGKTSLVALLAERRPELRVVDHWRRLSFLPSLTRDAVGLLPLFLGQWREGQALPRRDMERMIRLRASRRIAAGWKSEGVLMDQGPVYTLANLRLSRSGPARGERLETWWRRTAREWACVLDTVIYLEASDDVLLRRVGERSKPHRLQWYTNTDGLNWLATLRGSLERTVDELRVSSDLSVLHFDTSSGDLARIADRVVAELEGRRAGLGDGALSYAG